MKIIKIIILILVGLAVGLVFVVKSNILPSFTKQVNVFFSSFFDNQKTSVDTSDLKNSTSSKNKLLPEIATQKSVSSIIAPDPLQILRRATSDSISSGELSVRGVIYRTNYERKSSDLPVLTESKQLDASAQVKAEDILKRQYFEHTAPDGVTAKDLITKSGYTFVRIGENLALGDFPNDAELLTAWMNSPGHRANILDSRYQEIGIGLAYGMYQGRTAVVAVQHFGRPRSSCPTVDNSLKNKVEDYQKQIIEMSKTLDTMKTYIDSTRAKGGYVENVVIDAFNNAVTKYDSLVTESENARNKYNLQVELFNVCLSSLE